MKKILITGSAGFLGRHCVDWALDNGYEVVGLDLNGDSAKFSKYTHIKGDIRKRATVEKAMKGCDYVLHLAAWSSLADFKKNMYSNYEINVLGFMNMIDVAYKNKVKKFVYASSSAVYLDGRGVKFREDEPLNQNRLNSHYGKSKLINDMIAGSYKTAYNFPRVGIRYFNVYGSGDEKKLNHCAPMQHFHNAIHKKKPIVIYGDGKQAKDFIHWKDAVRITFMMLEDPAIRGIYNVGTGKATSFNEVARLLKEQHKGSLYPNIEIKHIPNPLDTYQFFTRANMDKLRKNVIGKHYKFIPLEKGLRELEYV